MLNIVCHHKNRLVLFCQIVEVDSLISWFKCSVWLQSQTKLVETLCPKGSDLWCFASLKERQNKAFLPPLPLHMLTLLWHWLSYYCVPVKKQQTPQLWMEEGGEGWGLLCSPKLPHRSTGLQHCFNMVSNGYNIAPTLQRCVALKIELSHVTSSLKAPPQIGGYSVYISLIMLFVFQGSWSGDSSTWFCTGGHGWLVH